MKNFKMWAQKAGLKVTEHKEICAVSFEKNGTKVYYDKYQVMNSFTKKNLEEIAILLA